MIGSVQIANNIMCFTYKSFDNTEFRFINTGLHMDDRRLQIYIKRIQLNIEPFRQYDLENYIDQDDNF